MNARNVLGPSSFSGSPGAGVSRSPAQRALVLVLAVLLVPVAGIPQAKSPGPAATGSSLHPPAGSVPSTPAPPTSPDKNRARKAYQEGRRAEQAGDWKTAYASYSEAATYAPDDKTYSAEREHARFQVVQGMADAAERQLLAGDIAGARAQLLHALQIDPNYAIATERLADLPNDSVQPVSEAGPHLAGLPHVKAKPGTRDFDVRGTTRAAYQEVGRQFGVTVIFDGDLTDHSIRFSAPMVDYETALKVLERETHTFSRAIDEHTLFVAEDNAQKRRDYEPEIEKNLLLPASETTDEMNETVRMIREMTGIARTQLDTASRTLTVRSTEHNVALAQALVNQIERPHGELMLEIEILEVDREVAHQLGITPPTSAQAFSLSSSDVQQLQQAQNNGTLVQVLQSLFGTGGPLANVGVNPLAPAVIAFGGGMTTFFATLPGATANFGQTLNAVRSAQRLLMRAQDGKAATFFVGDRYPISLATLSDSLSPTASALAAGLPVGSFPRTDYTVGNSPVALAEADFNGDGIPDLVVANKGNGTASAPGSLSILLGTGGGAFGTPTTLTIGTPQDVNLPTPTAVALGNFGGDADMDIAVTDSANNSVKVLRGNGTGGFTSAVSYPTGNGPVALLVGGFNANGYPDLAVVNQVDGTVSILLGQNNGTFTAKTDYPVGSMPVAIASADFTNNGVADLAVTNNASATVSVLLGNGDGTFGTKTDYTTGALPEGVATADYNGDGMPDLAVAYQSSATGTDSAGNSVSILLGNGNGTFGTATDFPAGSGPVGIVAGDLAGGTYQDLAVADELGNDLDILAGNGNGTFSTVLSLPTGNAPVAVIASDLTGGGTLDLISANESSNTVTVTLNTLQSLLSSSSISAAQSAYPAAQYVDLGLKVKATPHLHSDNEVTLELSFEIRALAGTAINGIPILTNRTIEQTIRLSEDQMSVLSGLISSDETKSISGYPGAATVPAAGLLAGENTYDKQDTEMLIIVTPRAMRLPPHNPPALYAGPGEPATAPAAAPGPLPGAPPGATPPPGRPPGAQGPGPAPGATPAPGTPPGQAPGQAPGQGPGPVPNPDANQKGA